MYSDELIEMCGGIWKDTPMHVLREMVMIAQASNYSEVEGLIMLTVSTLNKIYERTKIKIKLGKVPVEKAITFKTSLTPANFEELGAVLTQEQLLAEVENRFTEEISENIVNEIKAIGATTLVSGPFMSKIYKKNVRVEVEDDTVLNFNPIMSMTCVTLLYDLQK